MFYKIDTIFLSIFLFVGIIAFYFSGLKLILYKKRKNQNYESSGIGPFEGAMLGLISLLLAFTLNQSASFYNLRKDLIIHETNAISTVIHRTDMYPDSVRNVLRSDLKDYVESRIRYYEAGTDEINVETELGAGIEISHKIWLRVAEYSKTDINTVRSMQMVSAITDMVDSISKRNEIRKKHIPETILWLLVLLCFAGSFIVGYSSKSKKADWIILLAYSCIMVMTIYVIIDLDKPREGIIRTAGTHQNINLLKNTLSDGHVERK